MDRFFARSSEESFKPSDKGGDIRHIKEVVWRLGSKIPSRQDCWYNKSFDGRPKDKDQN